MSIDMVEKNKEMLWQLNVKLYFRLILFLISSMVLVIGILFQDFFRKFSDYPTGLFGFLLMGLFGMSAILLLGLPLAGFTLALIDWLAGKSLGGKITYFATHDNIIDKREKKEYIEYFIFEYSNINKIEIKPRFFFKKRGVLIRIFPEFNLSNTIEWSFKFFKEHGVKVPQLFEGDYHVLYNVSNYKPLLKILEQNHVKIIKK